MYLLYSTVFCFSGGYHARQRSTGDHSRQQHPVTSNFTHHRTGSTPNQASHLSPHLSPRMQHKQYQQLPQHKPPTSQGLYGCVSACLSVYLWYVCMCLAFYLCY